MCHHYFDNGLHVFTRFDSLERLYLPVAVVDNDRFVRYEQLHRACTVHAQSVPEKYLQFSASIV